MYQGCGGGGAGAHSLTIYDLRNADRAPERTRTPNFRTSENGIVWIPQGGPEDSSNSSRAGYSVNIGFNHRQPRKGFFGHLWPPPKTIVGAGDDCDRQPISSIVNAEPCPSGVPAPSPRSQIHIHFVHAGHGCSSATTGREQDDRQRWFTWWLACTSGGGRLKGGIKAAAAAVTGGLGGGCRGRVGGYKTVGACLGGADRSG